MNYKGNLFFSGSFSVVCEKTVSEGMGCCWVFHEEMCKTASVLPGLNPG